jgi:hypothetical protein
MGWARSLFAVESEVEVRVRDVDEVLVGGAHIYPTSKGWKI